MELIDILKLNKDVRNYIYKSVNIDKIEIDGNLIKGYFEYSFFNAKSYIKSPNRTLGGSIEGLNQYVTFLTPRLRIKFNMMSIDTYRVIMKLLQKKNEFAVTCYDVVEHKTVTHNMYFEPEDFPLLFVKDLETLAVMDYEIQLNGTNTGVEEITIMYHQNYGDMQVSQPITVPKNRSVIIGEDVTFQEEGREGYRFAYWSDTPDDTGFRYVDGDAYFMNSSANLYAIWDKSFDFDLELAFFTGTNIEIGMAGRNKGNTTYGLAYNWDIYLNNKFAGNFTGVTSATQTITLQNNELDLHTVKMICKLEDTDYCARSVAFYGSASIGSYDKLTSAKGFGNAFNGTSAMPNYCYYYMFRGCTNLVNAPSLPATSLASYCYSYMFRDCTNLVNAPSLPATSLADSCYRYMFRGCTNLVNAPSLPATTLENSCYYYMFRGCTNLVNAPSLPATSLAIGCYMNMFVYCTNLVTAPELPATSLADSCYRYMFQGCTNLVTAPSLPATTLANSCYLGMFSDCTNLTEVRCHYASNLAYSYASNWLLNITTVGKLYSPNAVITYGKPANWTAESL